MIYGRKNVALYLPESFEWLILSAGVLNSHLTDRILDDPSAYVESKDYFSWERFFTALLMEETRDTYLAYAKRKLNRAYLSDTVKQLILGQMEKIKLTWKNDLQ